MLQYTWFTKSESRSKGGFLRAQGLMTEHFSLSQDQVAQVMELEGVPCLNYLSLDCPAGCRRKLEAFTIFALVAADTSQSFDEAVIEVRSDLETQNNLPELVDLRHPDPETNAIMTSRQPLCLIESWQAIKV
jgi:hypothetical protein